jgi:diguanylate cyclase
VVVVVFLVPDAQLRAGRADEYVVRTPSRDSPGISMAAIIGACVLAALPLALLSGTAATVFALLASTALALTAGVAGAVAARRATGRPRAGWFLLAVAAGSWGLGNAYWSHNELRVHAEVLFPSLADIGFLIFPVAAGAGLWLISGRSTLGSRLTSLLDGLIVTAALFVASWVITLREVWQAGADSIPAFVVSLAYPVGDLVLATMALLLAARTRRGSRTVIGLLITGLLSMAVADTVFAVRTADGTYVSGAYSDTGWVLAFLAFALAGVVSARRPMSLQSTGIAGRWQLSLPYLPFGVASLLSAVQVITGYPVDRVQAVVLLIGFGLVLVRQLLTVVRNSTLTEQLRFQAFHDSLTALGNRALFTECLEETLASRIRLGTGPTMLYLDLDDFKMINDTLGHDAGDHLLRTVADRLRAGFPDAEAIARLGGDEFAILIENTADPAVAAQRMLDILRPPFLIGTHSVAMTASVGAARRPDVSVGPEDLRKNVDLAMYAAKARGKNAYAVFEPAMRETFDAEMALREELQRALADDSLYVLYQPIVELDGGRVAGLEALARWRHPTMGEIPPAEFIPVAEHAAMIDAIGQFVLDRACAEFAAWFGADDTYLSVNVSPLQLLDPAFPEHVLDTLRRHGLRPGQLVLEITEESLADESYVIPALRRLRASGLRIAIDDFGAGYSSLRYLHRLPADIIKIDRGYVSDIGSDRAAGRLVETLWQMFSALGLIAVAEGVEDAAQAAILTEMGCPLAQGYLFGRPVAIADVPIRRRSDLSRAH